MVYAEVLADVIEGRPRSEVLRSRAEGWAGKIDSIAARSWRGLARAKLNASGYVAHALEASRWAVGRTATYRSAVLQAANLGEDGDATAAITGQLAGASYGERSRPGPWLGRLVWRTRIALMADDHASRGRVQGGDDRSEQS